MIKNIVYVYDQAFLSGGAAKIVIGEALEMRRRGLRIIYFAGVGSVCSELTDAGIEVICLNEEHIAFTKNPKGLIKGLYNKYSFNQLESILMSLSSKETVVHIHGWTKALSSSVFYAAYKKGFKTFVTLHEYFTICQNGGIYNYKRGQICTIRPGSFQCMLCNCDKRSYIQKIYRNVRQIIQNRIFKIAKPIPIYITRFSENTITPFYPYESISYRLTNHVEISTDKERIFAEDNANYLFIGRVSDEKGVDLFCESIVRLNKSGIVIGKGPLLEKYREQYHQIQFVGWKNSEEIKPYLNNARCLIISSKWYETMGLTIIEMQQYGIPCVVPGQCAGSEYIQNNKTGLIYEIGELRSLMKTIDLTTSDELVQKLSRKFYSTLDAHQFSKGWHCDKLIDIYREEIKK